MSGGRLACPRPEHLHLICYLTQQHNSFASLSMRPVLRLVQQASLHCLPNFGRGLGILGNMYSHCIARRTFTPFTTILMHFKGLFLDLIWRCRARGRQVQKMSLEWFCSFFNPQRGGGPVSAARLAPGPITSYAARSTSHFPQAQELLIYMRMPAAITTPTPNTAMPVKPMPSSSALCSLACKSRSATRTHPSPITRQDSTDREGCTKFMCRLMAITRNVVKPRNHLEAQTEEVTSGAAPTLEARRLWRSTSRNSRCRQRTEQRPPAAFNSTG